MTTTTRENRPDPKGEAAPEVRWTAHPQDTGEHPAPHLSPAEIAAFRPTYVLLVKTPTDRVTRRVYLSLHAAVKATERAQARGHAASLELARLVPYATGVELHGMEVGTDA